MIYEDENGTYRWSGINSKTRSWIKRRRWRRRLDAFKNPSGYAILFVVGWALTCVMLYGALRQAELPVRRADNIDSIRQDWKCGECACNFPGLTYSTPIDRRFERDKTKCK